MYYSFAFLLSLSEWYWKLWVLPWAYRVGAVSLAFLSVVIVWCEVTFGIYISDTVRLSVLGAIVHVLHDYGNYIAVEVRKGCGHGMGENGGWPG